MARDVKQAAAGFSTPGAVSAVVVSHDSGDCLRACVGALLQQPELVEICVVDNASSDGAPARLPDDARVRLLHNASNLGFSIACNQGAAATSAAYLLFINPDCELPEGALARMREALDAHPAVGVLGAQLLNEDGSPQAAARRETPTPRRALRAMLGMRAAVESPLADARVAQVGVERVDAISGALMLMRREVFDRLRGFDEGYRLHCEDLDLCRRVPELGLDVALLADLAVLHRKGTSSRRRPYWVEWQKHRGMLRYFRKFDAEASSMWMRAAVPAGIVLHYLVTCARMLSRRSGNSAARARSDAPRT